VSFITNYFILSWFHCLRATLLCLSFYAALFVFIVLFTCLYDFSLLSWILWWISVNFVL